jgi:hypothetical protein
MTIVDPTASTRLSERLTRVVRLMADGRWYGPLTVRRLATEWGVTTTYVGSLARAASAALSSAA